MEMTVGALLGKSRSTLGVRSSCLRRRRSEEVFDRAGMRTLATGMPWLPSGMVLSALDFFVFRRLVGDEDGNGSGGAEAGGLCGAPCSRRGLLSCLSETGEAIGAMGFGSGKPWVS